MQSWSPPVKTDVSMRAAMRLHQAGRLDEAARAYQAVLSRQPQHAEALHLLGVVHLQRGQFSRAVELIRSAADRRPNSLDILGNLAAAHARAGQFEEALAVFDRILSRTPRNASAQFGRSTMLLNLGRPEDALKSCDRALAIEPQSVPFLFHRGNLLAALGRFEDAVGAMDRVLALVPGHIEAMNNRGNALSMLDRHDEAIASFDRALAIRPDYLEALNNRSNALKRMERYEEAIAGYEAVLARNPRHADALSNCGGAMIGLRRASEALSYLDRALAIDPRHVRALSNRATALLHLDRHDEALACAKASLEIDPDNYEASYFCLVNGEFSEGWRLYERRPNAHALHKRAYTQPSWNGEPVAGTLLLSGEQGLGDQILYAAFIPELERKAGHLVVEVEPRLVDLFSRSFPRVEVVAMREELYAGDIAAHTMMASAAKFLRPDWNSFKHHPDGFLRADETRVADFRARLGGKLSVGISWHSKKAATGTSKSAHLIDFYGLFDLGDIRLVDLQYGDTESEREACAASTSRPVTHFDDLDLTGDIDGLAALISACDVVVTVSNTTAHIAGAIGKKTWVMPPSGHARIWYWVERDGRNPWYPSISVRQQRSGQTWADVVSSVRNDVAAFAAVNANR